MKEYRGNWCICPFCHRCVRSTSIVKFEAFGIPFNVCRICAKEAVKSIEEASKEKECEKK